MKLSFKFIVVKNDISKLKEVLNKINKMKNENKNIVNYL